MYEHCLHAIPRWNASNICSYHLQEAGATPAQELAFALANAMACSTRSRARGRVTHDEFERSASAASSFFVNAGIRFVEEMCKMRAFGEHVGRDHARALRRRRSPSTGSSATACR